MRLSFKRGPKPTGLTAIAHPHADVDIKADGKVVGHLIPPSPTSHGGSSVWRAMFAVKREKTQEDPCCFKWITLNKKTETEQEMRDFIKEGWDTICKRYDLYQFED